VWHHRRPTIRAFLRQQRGYGYAESHLRRRYPGRFNVFGDLVWAGSIYDGTHTQLRQQGLPRLLPPRVYQGRFGSAPFQAVYQPFQAWWFQVFTTAEWQVASWCTALAGVSTAVAKRPFGFALWIVASVMPLTTWAAAAIPAVHAVRARRWARADRRKAFCVIAALHVLQPLARAWGQVVGTWETRRSPRYPVDQRLYGNLSQRERWLDRLQRHLHDCGWKCRVSDDWDVADLDILGPGPYRLQLCSVYEDDVEHGQHFVRYRVTARPKRWLPIAWLALIGSAALIFRMPCLVPLALPLAALGRGMFGVKRYMQSAVSQLAAECAEPLGMIKVEVER
jgi:hypothetical protein